MIMIFSTQNIKDIHRLYKRFNWALFPISKMALRVCTALALHLSIVGVSIVSGSTGDISPSNSLVFGSGISPLKHPLPIQYVYLQLRTASNSK